MAAHGYRAVAPDLRGFGDTTGAPINDHTKFSMLHLVGDMVALLDAIEEEKAFVVCQDWGAYIGWSLCLYRPDRVRGLVSLGAPFIPRNPHISVLDMIRALYGDDHFICRFQEPGVTEAVIKGVGTKTYLKKVLTIRDIAQILVPKGNEFGDTPDDQIILPSWLSEADIDYFTAKFEQTGFTGGLNYYRSYNLNWELNAAWTGAQVQVPTMLIARDQDPVYHVFKEYIYSDEFKKDVPLLEQVVVMEGVAHFINQEKPDEVNKHIFDFIQNF